MCFTSRRAEQSTQIQLHSQWCNICMVIFVYAYKWHFTWSDVHLCTFGRWYSIFCTIYLATGQVLFQQGLEQLSTWSDSSCMTYNSSKSNIMHIIRQCNSLLWFTLCLVPTSNISIFRQLPWCYSEAQLSCYIYVNNFQCKGEGFCASSSQLILVLSISIYLWPCT